MAILRQIIGLLLALFGTVLVAMVVKGFEQRRL